MKRESYQRGLPGVKWGHLELPKESFQFWHL